MEKQLLTGVDVGFFEQPSPNAKSPILKINPEKLGAEIERLKNTDPSNAKILFYEGLLLPKQCVCMDESEEAREKFDLKPLEKFFRDRAANKIAENDPAYLEAIRIAKELAQDRLITSNAHMSGVITDHMNHYFLDQKAFLAVAIAGKAHIHPSKKQLPLTSDIKQSLLNAGFHVVAIDFKPIAKSAIFSKDGKYAIKEGHETEPSIDFTIEITDSKAFGIRNNIESLDKWRGSQLKK